MRKEEDMKLIIVRDQASKGVMSKKIRFSITARVELTEQEQADIRKYKLGNTILYTNLVDRGSGVLGAISRKAMGVEFTINDLSNGRKIESEDIAEIIGLEEQIISAAKNFKEILQASSMFGNETVIEL